MENESSAFTDYAAAVDARSISESCSCAPRASRHFSMPLGEYVVRSSDGLNIYFDPAVALRFSNTYSRLFDLEAPERTLSFNCLPSLAARLSIAF